jgi:MFS-type transporter involved in bile tolerance (Atg22 family)
VIISESGGTSLLPVVVAFYSRVLRYDSIDVGLTFFVAVLTAIPGAIVNTNLCRRYNPKISLRFNFVFLFCITITAPFVLTSENPRWLGYVWGVLWGFSLGWMYSGEQLFYTLCMPESQETEFAGFFVYCTVILTWLPSLIYSTIVENGYKEQYGLGSLCLLQLISIAAIAMVPEWDEVIEGSKMKLLAPPDTQSELPSTTTDRKRSEITQESQDLAKEAGEISDSSDVARTLDDTDVKSA